MRAFPLFAIFAVCSAFLSVRSEEPEAADNSWNAGWKLTSDYSLKEPFDPKELTKLASDPNSDDRRLMLLILRAGIEKDNGFQALLKMPKLRQHTNEGETALETHLDGGGAGRGVGIAWQG